MGILNIKDPELLFTKENIESEFRALAKKYHPDVGGDTEIFSHINYLHTLGLEKLAKGSWEIPGVVEFTSISGGGFRLKHEYKLESKAVTTYYSNTVVAYSFAMQAFYQKYREFNFKYPNKDFETEFSKYLPKPSQFIQTSDHYIVIVPKTIEVVPLSGIKALYPAGLDPKHVAWIMSSLHNLLCYLEYTGLTHLAINLDTYFISPEHHTGLLLGGWEYSTIAGQEITYVPKDTYNLLGGELRKDKTARIELSGKLIKVIGRQLMGDFMSKKNHPELTPMIDWLLAMTSQSPQEQFKCWDKVLKDTFGKRKFIKFEVDNNELYRRLNDGIR